jgi:hypothetical protein
MYVNFLAKSNVGMIFSEIKCWEVIEPIHPWAPARDTRKSSHVFEQRQSNDVWNFHLCKKSLARMYIIYTLLCI